MDVSPFACMFKGDCTNISLSVNIQNYVFIEIPGFDNVSVTEFNVERVRIIEVLNFHVIPVASEITDFLVR